MKNILFVLANATAGREAEFNEWYNGRHLAETLAIDENFETGRRFALAADARMTKDCPDAPFGYVALYEVDDIEAADAALHRVARVERAEDIAAGRTPVHVKSDAMDDNQRTWWYRPISGIVGTPSNPADPDKKILTVFSNALEGRDEEYNEWYTGYHLQEILNIDEAFVNAQRFELATDLNMTRDTPDAPYRYVAVYEVTDIEKADAALYALARTERAEAVAAGRTPKLVMSSSMSPVMRTWWWDAAGPVVDRSAVPAILAARAEATR